MKHQNYLLHQHPALYCAVSVESGALVMGYPWVTRPVKRSQKLAEGKMFMRVVQLDTPPTKKYYQFADIEVDGETLCMASPFYYTPLGGDPKNPVPLFEWDHVMAFNKSDERAAFAFLVRYGAFLDESGHERFGFYGEKTMDPHENCKETLLSLGDLCKDYILYTTTKDLG